MCSLRCGFFLPPISTLLPPELRILLPQVPFLHANQMPPAKAPGFGGRSFFSTYDTPPLFSPADDSNKSSLKFFFLKKVHINGVVVLIPTL